MALRIARAPETSVRASLALEPRSARSEQRVAARRRSVRSSASFVAVAFALAACRSVHLYGLGGGGPVAPAKTRKACGRGDVRCRKEMAVATYKHRQEMSKYMFWHNLGAERRWLESLVAAGRAAPVCF